MASRSMPSRPVHAGLLPVERAVRNIIVVEGEAADAVIDMAAKSRHGFFSTATILSCPAESAGHDHAVRLRSLTPAAIWMLPTQATALHRLSRVLQTATMGTRVYVAGSEAFMGAAIRVAIAAGIDPVSIVSEQRGPATRRVQCVHCKGITDRVRQSPVPCGHCGLMLLVRDHYSQRLGAFQGVCVDAEVPGDVPAPAELAS